MKDSRVRDANASTANVRWVHRDETKAFSWSHEATGTGAAWRTASISAVGSQGYDIHGFPVLASQTQSTGTDGNCHWKA